MKYNNIDVLMSQRLTSIQPTNMILYYTRINDEEGIDPSFSNVVKILRAFILSKEIIEQATLPAQLIEALKEFMGKKESDIIQRDVEHLFSIFDYYNYPIKIVGRLDLNGQVYEEVTDDQVAYVLCSYDGNNTNTSGFYSGYAKLYDISRKPLAMDFLEYFNLSPAQLSAFDLEVSMRTYVAYTKENRLNDFDDTIPLEFLKSRKMEFVVERTV
jgi:hypothetical protein